MSQQPLFHFEISERKVILRLFDIIVLLATLSLVGIIFKFDYFRINTDNWIWTFVLIIYFNIIGNVFEIYDLKKASKFDTVLKNVLLTSSVTVLFFILTPFLTPSLPDNRLQILFFFLSIALPVLLWRFLYITLISSPRFYKRVIIVGDAYDINLLSEALQRTDPNYVIVGFVDTGEPFSSKEVSREDCIPIEAKDLDLAIKEHHINEIVVADANQNGQMLTLYYQLSQLLKAGFPVRDYNQVYEELTYRLPVQHVDKDFSKYFPFSRSNKNRLYKVSFRFFDVVVSILGILLLALLSPIVMLGNLIANRGELFYFQDRVGKHGKIFRIIKFRTMLMNAEELGPQYAQKDDSRITNFGKFLRRSRLDEVPQFINVFRGDMSLIGPRPERPVFVKELSEIIPFYDIRHIIKPGLTGWAQVKANYGTSHTDSLEKLQYDLYYIKHRGVFLDLSILLKTFSTVLFFRGQ